MARRHEEQAVELPRALGLLDAVGIGIGAIVGAGIFVVTGVAAGVAGPAFLLGLLLAGVAAAANALSSAQLAAAYPRAGGTYEYGYRVLSPALGFAAGWLFLASKITAAGTVALGLAGYLEALRPGLPPRAVAFGAVVVFTALNYFGIRRSSRANLVIVAISVGALLLFVIAGIPSFRMSNLRPFAPAGWGGVLRAAALLFFAYTGYARIATLGEEVREPQRTIPRAIEITIGGVLILYLAVALVATGTAGTDALARTAAPLEAAARSFRPGWVPTAVAAGGVAAMLGVILSQLLGLSRMAFAMARRGDLPRFLDAVHPRYGVPGRAALAVGGAAAVVAATGTLAGVAATASFTILLYYGIANLAALRMPREAKLFSDAVPVFGLAACTLLAFSLSPRIILTGLALLAVGFLVRWIVRGA
ncbi:MAG: amino acid permease [bacterium]|jgi:APA family basic amino acid/polyamine antiporter|nr:MAG: amino acid permease [bacterium]